MADINMLYMKALKEVAKARHSSTGLRKVHASERDLIKQRARWASGMKDSGKSVYIKTTIGKHKVGVVYQLKPSDVKKWGKVPKGGYEFDAWNPYDLEAGRVGKLIFEVYQGSWKHSPVDWRNPSGIKTQSPEGDILHHKTIDLEKYGRGRGLREAIEKALGPQKKNNMSHYKALLAEHKKIGLPTGYATDLTNIDHHELQFRDPSLPLGYIFRQNGTQMIYPESTVNAYNREDNSPGVWERIVDTRNHPEAVFYAWDGISLRKKDRENWKEWIDREHRKMRGEKEE